MKTCMGSDVILKAPHTHSTCAFNVLSRATALWIIKSLKAPPFRVKINKKEKKNKTKPLLMKCGARYSQNTDKPTIWYPQSSPPICCVVWFFRDGEKYLDTIGKPAFISKSLRGSAQQGWRQICSTSLRRGGPQCLLLCGQHCRGLCSISSPHGLPHASCQNMPPKLFPEYMVFRCHEGPGGLCSSLSVLPTVFEEQVPSAVLHSRWSDSPLQYVG